MEKRELAEVVVLGHDSETAVARELPNGVIGLASEPGKVDVLDPREDGVEAINELWAQVRIQQQAHPTGGAVRRRSRAAANARQARMSSRVRPGKSPRT